MPSTKKSPTGDDTPSTSAETVSIGGVTCTQQTMPLADVQALLPNWAERIDALRSSQSISHLQARMRATEGQCAPVVFSREGDDGHMHLVAGLESVAAAMNLGLDILHVVVVPAGEAEAIQAVLAHRIRTPDNPSASPA